MYNPTSLPRSHAAVDRRDAAQGSLGTIGASALDFGVVGGESGLEKTRKNMGLQSGGLCFWVMFLWVFMDFFLVDYVSMVFHGFFLLII